MNYTYLLECSDGTLYCGWTNDLEKRVKAHNSGRGAKYTKSRRPVRLVWYETFETKEEAMSREVKVKQLSRNQRMNWWPMGRLKGRFPEKPRKRAAEHCLLRWPQENITYKAEMHRFLKWIFASICEKTEQIRNTGRKYL